MELVIFFTELSLSLPISTYISTFSRKSLIAAVYSLKEYHVTPVLSSQKGIRGKNINSKIEHLRAVLACVNSILWDLICFQTFPSVILTASHCCCGVYTSQDTLVGRGAFRTKAALALGIWMILQEVLVCPPYCSNFLGFYSQMTEMIVRMLAEIWPAVVHPVESFQLISG